MNVILNEIYLCRWVFVAGDQVAICSRAYRVTTAENNSQPQQDCAVTFDSVHVALWKAVLSPGATYRGVILQRMFPLPRTFPSVVTASAGVGTGAAGDLLPRQTSGIITFTTELAGPGFRGRMYAPFPSEGMSEADGTPTAAYVTALQALGTRLVQTVNTADAGADLVVMSPVLTHFSTPGNSHPLVTAIARDRWATQRRRGTYGRPNVSPI